jgi:hypothetical protein
MEALEQLKLRLQRDLRQAEQWIRAIDGFQARQQLPITRVEDLGRETSQIRALRTRAASTLLTVAFLGEFSSGKSFLISGLQGHLKLEQVQGNGRALHKYTGLLPSSPRPTNSCPATVVPVEALASAKDNRNASVLRVRFSHSTEWEELSSEDSPLIAAAYATDLPEYVAGRRDSHRQLEVAEVELLITDHLLPAKLYDLPGHNAPNKVHDGIVRELMQNADCFVYVSKATRVLSESDLELIRFLYNHHNGKKVIWAVTAIDLAQDVGFDNRPNWMASVAQNNEYLKKNFVTPDGEPDLAFFGDGFVGVSPALEAQGRFLQGTDPTFASTAIAESRMADIRRILTDVIEAGSGHRHLVDVATEARAIIHRRQQELNEILATERVPFDELEQEESALQKNIEDLNLALESIRSSLSSLLERRLRKIMIAFSSEALSKELHRQLDDQIRQANLRSERVVNQLEVRRTQVVRDWFLGENGPTAQWDAELESLRNEATLALRQTIRLRQTAENGHGADAFNLDLLRFSSRDRSAAEAEDVLDRAMSMASHVVPLAGTVVATIGAATGSILFLPVGLGVIAAGAWTAFRRRRRADTVLELLREEEIRHLDHVASEAASWFAMNASVVGNDLVYRTCEIAQHQRTQAANSLVRVRQRRAQLANVERQELIRELEAMCAEGKKLLTSLEQLHREDRPTGAESVRRNGGFVPPSSNGRVRRAPGASPATPHPRTPR